MWYSKSLILGGPMQRTFTRNLASLEPLFAFIDSFAKTERLNESVTFAVNLAVEELFTNMVKYGGGGDDVSLDMAVRGHDLVIHIDHPGAAPFDISGAPEVNVDGSLAERTPGGIGLHLVRKMMDSLTYDYHNGTARVTVIKRLGGD